MSKTVTLAHPFTSKKDSVSSNLFPSSYKAFSLTLLFLFTLFLSR